MHTHSNFHLNLPPKTKWNRTDLWNVSVNAHMWMIIMTSYVWNLSPVFLLVQMVRPWAHVGCIRTNSAFSSLYCEALLPLEEQHTLWTVLQMTSVSAPTLLYLCERFVLRVHATEDVRRLQVPAKNTERGEHQWPYLMQIHSPLWWPVLADC